jgi:cytochrome c oxidase subunit 2
MIQNFYFNWALLVSNPRGSLADLIAFLTKSNLYADFAEKWALGFQDPASPWMYAIIELHDRIMFYLIIILIVVLWFLVRATLNTNPMNFHHGNVIELICTLTPAGILWAIGLPSLKLLYMIDEILDAEITVKAIGNQWYWSYEFCDYVDSLDKSVTFDSFMVSEDSLEEGDLRQLTVDNY